MVLAKPRCHAAAVTRTPEQIMYSAKSAYLIPAKTVAILFVGG